MTASRLPVPPGILPGLPDGMVDLSTDAGVELIKGQWRYHDAQVVDVAFRSVWEDLNPTGPPNQTYDIVPHAQVLDFDDSSWESIAATDLDGRRGTGKVCFNWYRINVTIPESVGSFDPTGSTVAFKVCFNWYRINVTIPESVGSFDPTGSTVAFEVIVDDYAEVWVNGEMPRVVGQAGGTVVSGFNSPNRLD